MEQQQRDVEVDRNDGEEKSRTTWQAPKLERQEMLPRVTNGFGGSFTP
jgi:hypothetical protein